MTASFLTIGPKRVDRAIPCASSKHLWKVSPTGPEGKLKFLFSVKLPCQASPFPARIFAATAKRPFVENGVRSMYDS